MLNCYIFNLELDDPILDIFLVSDCLVIVSETKVYKVFLENCPKSVLYKEVFDFAAHTKEHTRITKVVYSELHQSFYFLAETRGDEKSWLCRFALDEAESDDFMHAQFRKRVDDVEIDKKDPLNLYLICQREVFKFSLSEDKGTSQIKVRRNSIGINVKRRRGKRKKLKKQKQETVFYDRVFSNPKNEISFFKFDQKMRYFYTNDDNVIRKYLFETKTLVHTFEGHKHRLSGLVFTEDCSFMVRWADA